MSSSQSQSSLARTQNKLGPVVHHLPEEILANIFRIAIANATRLNTDHTRSLRARYKCVYNLIGVCSFWRRVGLAQTALWSLIPLFGDIQRDIELNSIKRSLKRAGDQSDLHLAGDLDSASDSILPILTKYAPRFRTVNISSSTHELLRTACHTFVEHSSAGSTLELSVYRRGMVNAAPYEAEYLYSNSSDRTLFRRLVDSLHTFRIRGLPVHWEGMSFKALTELRIQDIALESSADLYTFLLSMASASSLRLLEIISATIWHVYSTRAMRSQPPIVLPSLKSLYMEDLHYGIASTILSGITRGHYRVILHCSTSNGYYSYDYDDVGYMNPLLVKNQPSIEVLMLSKNWVADNVNDLRLFLSKLPGLKTIYMYKQSLNRMALEVLVYPPENERKGRDENFPKLRSFYFIGCTIQDTDDQSGFKRVVTSHGIQELGFSGSFVSPPKFNRPLSLDSQNCDVGIAPFRVWLNENVPTFKSLSPRDTGNLREGDFETNMWKLWEPTLTK